MRCTRRRRGAGERQTLVTINAVVFTDGLSPINKQQDWNKGRQPDAGRLESGDPHS
jgi:hypothetical protein